MWPLFLSEISCALLIVNYLEYDFRVPHSTPKLKSLNSTGSNTGQNAICRPQECLGLFYLPYRHPCSWAGLGGKMEGRCYGNLEIY